MSNQYYGIEDLGLSPLQRTTLIDALKQISGKANRPNWKNHSRIRLDNKAVIFEGKFNDEDWTVAKMCARLEDIFNVPAGTITPSTTSTQYGPVVTFSAGTAAKMRMIAFGGLLASYSESYAAVLQFLEDNEADWNEAE